ncbi:MAG: ABC transporter ATP-binding protein [Gammaproteobacteria bacterium]|nr:ABC transporter ATP-binding protein [Gammaproteobacteria bacterium]
MLELKNVTRSFKVGPTRLDILKGVNLAINSGEVVSIMGESGCGKTTMMNILGLLDHPDSGDYTINNRSTTDYNEHDLAEARNKYIGFIFQSFFLLPRQTVIENVMLPLRYRKLSRQHRLDKAKNMLSAVGMLERSRHLPSELSGGQRQRVAIARSLVGDPEIILADEPTGALDKKVGDEVMQLLLKLNQQNNITLIIITHDPLVAQQCQKTVVMNNGQLQLYEHNNVS